MLGLLKKCSLYITEVELLGQVVNNKEKENYTRKTVHVIELQLPEYNLRATLVPRYSKLH
jgi:hypothetical protein